MSAPFQLSPAEKMLVGLKFDGQRLQIGPSLSRWLWMVLVTLIHGACAVFYVGATLRGGGPWWAGHTAWDKNALIALGVLYGLWWLAICWQILGQRIIATHEGVDVKQAFSRNKRFGWSQVSDIRLVDSGDSVASTRQPSWFGLDQRNLGVPVLLLAQGSTVWLRGFAPLVLGFRRPAARSLDEIDGQIGALRRFRDSLLEPGPSDKRPVDREPLATQIRAELWVLPAVCVIAAFHYLAR